MVLVLAAADRIEAALGREDRRPAAPTAFESPAAAGYIAGACTVPVPQRTRATDRAVRYHGHYYALAPETGYQWNKKAFVLLYQLFQMTVVKPASAAPSITIAK